MCDCFHLVLPNWPGSPASASGRQLRPEDTEADGEADAEDDSISEVTTESIRPRPQGSSPVYEYCIEDEYFNKKLQQDIENRQRRESTFKMSDSQESMEVTLQTEVESGASGFSVAGGGAEGIFVKQVLKESSASKLFSLREGDQLLSATIFFDNIKYEDALKILQYSEPYKVQFNLKRKLVGKDELETIHSATQSKKEKLSQGMDTMEISEKTISEEDKANLIVKQRVGRQKRTKKDRLSWPKFQSIKGKKILGHRRSRSTSDAYDHGIPDVSPTSTDTESQFLPEEIHGKMKKQSQKKLKFPTIGFKMHKSKQEPYEINPFKEYENDTTMELSEVMTTEYTSLNVDRKPKEKEPKRGVSDTVFPIPQHTKKYPAVEVTISKPKEKKQEPTVVKTQMKTAVIHTKDITDSQIKISQNIPKIRKKKLKDSKVQIETEYQKQEKGKETNIASKYALPQIEGPKVEVDIKMPKMDFSLPKADHKATKPELKMGEITGDINISLSDIKSIAGQGILELKTPDRERNILSDEIPVEGSAITLEDEESKFNMLKLQMPKFGISLPKGKGVPEEEQSMSSMEAELPKVFPEIEANINLTEVDIEGPSLDVEMRDKGKIKMPALKMPSVKVAKLKPAEVGITVPKIEADATLPKRKVEGSDAAAVVQLPEPKGTIDGGGLNIHMPSAKVPKLKGAEVGISLPKIEADVTLPKVKAEVSHGAEAVKLPEAEGTIDGGGLKIQMPKFKMPSMGFSKPDIKGPKVDMDISMPKVDVSLPEAELHVEKPEVKGGDIAISAPEVKIPMDLASLELKAPDVAIEHPSGKVSVQGPDVKLKSGDKKFQMPKFHMPKFGVSMPKGKGVPEAEIGIPSVEADLPKTELKTEITLSSAQLEADLKLPDVEVDAPSLDVEIGDKGKIKMPEVKMPSVKVPKLKGPEVGISLPNVEADVTLPKVKADVSDDADDIKLPETEGTIDRGGLKIHMPKFKMPSMGYSKPDIKGPKVDVDVSMPKVDVSLPEAELHVEKPEVKGGDITISAPEVKIPTDLASLELKAPDVAIEPPSVQGPDVKLKSGDRKFQMPKFHMPKFGISMPKGKGVPEAEIGIPSVEADLPKTELKTEITIPSVQLEADLKLPDVEVDAPSLDVEIGDKGKIKMPEVKMPSVKVPKLKGPKVDVSLPEAELHVAKPEVKGEDITISAPEIKIPRDMASLDLKAPDVDLELPSAKVSVEGPDVKVESSDMKFQMPKFHMPKFGISMPKGTGVPEAEIGVPSVEADLPKTELKTKITLPSAQLETDLKLPELEVDAPSLDVEIGDKGKIKMPEAKIPSIKVPKLKGPEIGISLPKVEADVTLPKVKAEVSDGAEAVKLPEAEGDIDRGGLKIHMPKFKMPSMGFSKPDIKGPKVDVDVSMPKVDVSLPEAELHVEKPEVKGGDITISAPEVKIPTDMASLELKAPDVAIEPPSVQGPDVKLKSGDKKFQMPKFHMPKFGISMPKGKGVPEAEISIPSVEAELPKTELKTEITLPSAQLEADLKLPDVEVDAPSLDVEIGDKGKIKMPEVKMPSVKVPKLKGPKVDVSLPKAELHVQKPEVKGEDITISAPEIKIPRDMASLDLKAPDVDIEPPSAKVSVEGPDVKVESSDMKFQMPKFHMPKFGISMSKGTGVPEAEIGVPSVEADLPKTELKTKITLPSAKLETDLKLPELEVDAPSLDVEIGDKGKIKMPEAKIPSIKVPKLKGPEIGISLPKVEADVTLPKVKAEVSDGAEAVKLPEAEGDIDRGGLKIHMPKFKMPSMGYSKPDIKGPKVDVDVSMPKVDVSLPEAELHVEKPEVKGGDITISAPEVKIPTDLASLELKAPDVAIEPPSVQGPDVKLKSGDRKFQMPKFHMPKFGISMPKGKGVPEAQIGIPSVEADLPKTELKTEITIPSAQLEADLKLPDVEVDAPSLDMEIGDKGKIKMPEVKMPSVKVPKLKGPKVDVSLPEAELHVAKPEVKGEDITISAPEIKIPRDMASLDLKAPDVDVELPSAKVSVEGPDVKVESSDMKFQMPKFHMPKFGISMPKGTGVPEAEIGVPSVEADLPKTELKTKITLPSAQLETDLKLPELEVGAPSLDVEIGDKGKIKMPEAKIPSIKVPKLKGPEIGISLPKVEADVTLPKVKAEVSDGAEVVKLPEAEGDIDRGGLKIHMPKFKMPSMGFSKPDIKGPKVDVDVSMPKVDVSLPEAELHVEKPEVKGGDITISAPEVKIPTDLASLELKAPDVAIEPPSVQGPDVKLKSGDRKFQMPKFHMPKFGISMPKGKGVPEAEIGIPSVEADLPKTELKTEITLSSAQLEADLKLPDVEVDAPSLDVEIGDKGIIKMPEVKMPSVKVPKLKGPEVGISLPKVEADVTLPKVKAEVSDGAEAVKLPEAEGTIDRGGLKIHMPKFKMPSMGFSKPDIKGHKVDVDVSMPKVDVSLPEAELHVEKPEVKGGDINISAPEIKIPRDTASLELKAPDVAIEPPFAKVSVEGPDGKLESGDMKFQMPKLHMPKFGISMPKGTGVPEAEIDVPSVEADLPKAELKTKITLPSVQPEADLKLPELEVDAPTLDVEIGDKGKIKMPEAKMPSIKVPKLKGPEVGISLPKVEADVTLPKVKAEVSDGAEAIKLPEAEGDINRGGLKIHMPKFKMPSMGFSKPDIKGPKVDVDVSMPKVDVSLPEAELHVEKPEVKGGDITISAPEVKIPTDLASLELKAPDVAIEPPSVQGPDVKLKSGDSKFQMPKFHMPKFGISMPKGKGVPEAQIGIPSVEADLPKTELKTEITIPSAQLEADLKLPDVEVDAPSLDVEIGDKGKIKMPEVKMPSVKVPKLKGPKVDVSLPEAELHVAKPEVKGEDITISAPEIKIPRDMASLDLKAPDVDIETPSAKVSVEGPNVKVESSDMKFQMPKFHMPKFGISMPKGTGVPEAEIGVPSVEADLPKTELKTKITLPSAQLETDLKLPELEVDAPSLDVEIGDKGKIKMPEAKIPSIKVPKLKGPEIGISLPKVEADVTLPKVKAEVSDGAEVVKLPEAEGDIDRGGLKIHMPKFKMPSMGFSKPDIKGPKVDVDVSMPKVDVSLPEAELHVEKPEVKGGDITISAPEVKIPTDMASLELKAPDVAIEPPSVQGPDVKLKSGDRKFQMPKFHMPKFGISMPKGKGVPEAQIGIPSVEADLPKTELKTEITIPSAQLEADLKLPDVEVDAPSLDVEVGDKGKIKMPEVKMPSVKVPKLKGPEVGISLPKVEADVTLPKVKAEVSDGAEAVKLPEAEGTIDRGGLKIHMPKFKMPSMGFSKPDIKGHKVDVDVSMPKVDVSLPEAELHVEKPEVKGGDINISAPEIKIPRDTASLELKAPDVAIEPPSAKVSVEGPDGKLESGDMKFQMPKLHIPKFGISMPKGTGVPEAEIDVPSVEADIPKAELKTKITLPSAQLEADLKLPELEVDAPTLDVEIGDKGKIKMPEAKMPSIKVPKLKAPEVGISLPKVEADVTLPKVKAEVSDGAEAVKLPEAEGDIDRGGLKIHMPKFKMPSMGFSKPDIKGPKVDVDVSMPKVDVSLSEAELHVEKPEVKGGDITISVPEVKIPMDLASLELKAPDVAIEPPSVQGPDVKLKSGDRKFQMPKFHMPKFGISMPKGKGVPEAEIGIPSVEADLPKTELKTEITIPSAQLEADLKLPDVEVDAPSLDVEIGDKGKIKMPEVKMPSVKVPKLKGPEVGISLPKVEADVTLPKVKAEVSDGAEAVKLPEAEGSIDRGGLKIHMPKFKTPSMGFSKPDIKGNKVDVDVSMPKVDVSLPKAELQVEKPEVKGEEITISAPEMKIPRDTASLDLKAPDVAIEPPSAKVSVEGLDVNLESGDMKFQMPKFHMPKFGISMPKGTGVPEAEIDVPSVEADLPKTELKTEIKMPSVQLEADLKLPDVEVDAPTLDVEIGAKGKIKMAEGKMPSVKVPKLKGPEVGISLPKVEADVTLPKVKAEMSDDAEAVKLPETEGTIDRGELKIHMPKFKMPSIGFSKPDIKGPKVDVDVSMPKVEISLPETEVHVEKPEVKGGDITISAPEVKIPMDVASLELKAPDVAIEPPSGKVSVQGPDVKLKSGDKKFQMPKFHMSRFGVSMPKGKGVPEAEIGIPSVEADLPKTELKTEIKMPSVQHEADLNLPEMEVDAPTLDVEIGAKGKIKMAEVKMPSVKVPKLKGPEVGISLPKVEPDVTLPKVKADMSDGAEVKLPEAEGTIDRGGLKIHMPKFKMPSMGFSKPDIKGPKVDVDVSMPKVDISLPEAELHVEKPEVKGGDITISAPEVKIPRDTASLELKAPDVAIAPPSGKVSVQGHDVKLDSGDKKFQMPKFQMPKFGISLPKGTGVPEAELGVPSVEADLPKTELKTEMTLPSVQLEAYRKLPEVEVGARNLDVEIGDKGKIKMHDVKIPSVKVPHLKGPDVGISLKKVEADVTLPKGKAEVCDGAVAVKLPEAEGTIDGRGLKIQMPKFKMPSIGFSKADIKGPKVDVDVSMLKMDVSVPEAEVHTEKPVVNRGDITISAPEVKIPTSSVNLEVKAPDVLVEPPSGKVSLHGPDVKLESRDRKFQMPKFHMPKFGISMPKGKGVPEGEISIPSVEVDLPKTELKTELKMPSVEFEADLKLPEMEVDAPSLEVDIVDESKMKSPDVKMPSIKIPKLKGPEVGTSLPKVEADVTVPKVKAEVSDGTEAVKLPEAEGSIDRGGLKIHMPKFKMPSMGFSKPDIKGPKVNVDVSMPKVDVSVPEAELHVEKPEVKRGDITISAPEVKIPTDLASLELKALDVAIEPPSGKVSVEGPDVKLESGDSKFKMPKFQMPKFGISKPKGKGFPEGEVIIPSMEGDLHKTGLKMEITLPSSELEADTTLPEVDMEAPSLDVDVEEKGKIKMPGVKLPSVKPPKLTSPEVDISVPKVEVDVSVPKANAEVPDSEAASKVVEAEGGREKGRMKIHMPKFKMPSMGFSKSDIKGPKIDSDAGMPDVHTSLPKVELSTTKPQLTTTELEGNIGIAAPEVKIPWVPVTVELEAPNIEVQTFSGKVPDIAIGLSKDVDVPQVKTTTDITDIAVEAPTIETESDVLGEKKNVLEQKIKMPQIIRADVKTAAVGISPIVTQSEVGIQDLHGAGKESETKGEIRKEGSLDGEEKAHFKMPKFKLPSLSWSPKKEASLKTNIKEPLEEPKLDIVSDDTGTEPKVTLSEDQGVHTDGNVDIATKKGQVKRPHLIMPKISLSKTKLPKAEVDIVVEGDGALVQIPDIESSFTTRKVEETEISIKMLKGEIKEETKTFQTDTDINLLKTDIKVPITKGSFEQKCLETEFKGDICMDSASMKSDGTEGEFRMPKLKMPKFGISDLSESDLSGSGITSPKPESDVSQFQMTTESDKRGGKAQSLQVKSDEGISEEIQTEESQSWFKMPKFKMPSFGRTPKTKKSDAETEDITGEAHVTELQVEVKSPKVVTISREPDSEKNISKQKVMLPQEDVIVQKEKQSTTEQLVGEGSFLHSSEKIGRKLSVLESKVYADIVKDGAEGESSQTEFTGTVPKMDIDRNIPKSEMNIQQPKIMDTMAVAEIPSTEITMGRKIDAIITDTEPLQSLDTQPEEMGTEKKSPKKDFQGKESIFKMPTFSVPLFGWSTTKSSAIVPGIESDLEEPAVTLSKVKMEVSITDEDFEIIDFPVEGFEKDLPKEGEVKAEEKEKTSKTKASKFKITKFANLRSKSQGAEIQVDSPKVKTEVSLVRSEGETSGIQVQDKKTGDAEVSFQMPKFKMPKFTHRISEGEKLISEETMEIKDTTDDGISQLQFKTMFPEEKGDDIQKSKVRITTLSEPAIQRPQVGSKFPSTDSSFADTAVYLHKQVPKEFSAEFLTEKIDTIDGNVQKSIAKITTLKEPDIQRAPLEIKLQPEDPFSSSASVQVKGSITDSKEIKIESKSTFGSGDDADIQETFSTQIVKESEIPPSEVKTAAFGFSLFKVKIQESHVSLDVPVKLSSTECMGEIFEDKDHQSSGTGEAAQKTGLSEVKTSDKDKDVTYGFTEGTSSAATLAKLKSFTVDIQTSSEFAESHSESVEISKSTEIAEETICTSSTDEVTDEKEKLDSKRSGRFKLWLPSIGFSSTTDDSTSDSKPEALQKVQPDDTSKLDSDTAKETDKTGWFKFPKLGFSSPTKKSKEMDKEKEADSEEEKDEENLTEKNETFFDAQETLSLTGKEENETSEPIVSSSARTELILLEKGKAKPKYTPEDSSK